MAAARSGCVPGHALLQLIEQAIERDGIGAAAAGRDRGTTAELDPHRGEPQRHVPCRRPDRDLPRLAGMPVDDPTLRRRYWSYAAST